MVEQRTLTPLMEVQILRLVPKRKLKMKLIDAHTGHELTFQEVCSCVGPGWHGIITRLIVDLEKLGWNGEIQQVKEKFGGLRFYVDTDSDVIQDRISHAELESIKTCEECSTPGKIRSVGGWLKCLCEEHSVLD